MSEMQINLGDAALIVTWLELRAAFAPLHMNEPAEVSRLHDIWRNSAPAMTWNLAVPGGDYDERNPRKGDNFKVIMNPIETIRWIMEISAKRGFPYTQRQAANLMVGIEDYGFD